jgi:hypothetical protein
MRLIGASANSFPPGGTLLPVRVIVNFQHRKGWNIHTMAEDCRTPLGPYRDVASEQTLRRLFAFLGATPAALEEAARDIKRWSRGGIHIDVPEDRLYLLGVVQRPIDLERRR